MPPEISAHDLRALVGGPPALHNARIHVDDPVFANALLLVKPPLDLPIGTCGRGRKNFNRQHQGVDLTPPWHSSLVGRNGQDKEVRLDEHVSMEGDVGGRDQDLRPWLVLEIIRQTNQQSSDSPLMSRGRSRRHNQLPADDLVAIAVVGEGADHGGSPAFGGVWHAHIVLGSARVAQVDTVQNAHSSIPNAYHIIASESAFTRGGFQKGAVNLQALSVVVFPCSESAGGISRASDSSRVRLIRSNSHSSRIVFTRAAARAGSRVLAFGI